MKRQILSNGSDIYIVGEKDFEPKHIFENGQAFRWYEKDGAYTIVTGDYVSVVKKLSSDEIQSEIANDNLSGDILKNKLPVVRLKNAGNIENYKNFWESYYDMDRDYSSLRKEFSSIDENLKTATEFATGLRVMKQDLFEMIISFIISANNGISRIKNSIDKICAIAGNPIIEIDGKVYHSFPSAKDIANLTIEQLSSTGIGYRSEYVKNTAKVIADGKFDLDEISKLPFEDAHKKLCELQGVGPKVADCILLFGNSRDIAFPVDTWVIKLMNYYYLGDEKNMKKIKAKGIELFGEKAGIAQQYLFYYARENKIGNKK